MEDAIKNIIIHLRVIIWANGERERLLKSVLNVKKNFMPEKID